MTFGVHYIESYMPHYSAIENVLFESSHPNSPERWMGQRCSDKGGSTVSVIAMLW